MAKLIQGTFSSWELSDYEILQGSILNQTQKMRIQNELADVANNILSLTFNPVEPLKFTQDEAFLKGQLSILRGFLLRSDEAEEQLLREARQSIS